MASGEAEAANLRELRERFERACRDNVSMEEAKKRIALDQIAANDRLLAARRQTGREQPAKPFWWQEGNLA